MKTMGKFGLCTVESYIGGEFFESNYMDTEEPRLKPYFPNIHASVGGAALCRHRRQHQRMASQSAIG